MIVARGIEADQINIVVLNKSPDAATIYDGTGIATAELVDCVTAPVNTVKEKSGTVTTTRQRTQ